MNFIFTIAFRNLFRQKRRNILLGTAIATGTAILILANAFAHGISDILFNQIIVYVAGHISVGFTNNGNMYSQVFHDAPRMKEVVRKVIPNTTHLQEAIGIMARAIGNGKSDNVIMVGMDLNAKLGKKEEEQYQKNFKIIEGNLDDLKNHKYELPVALAVDKAKYLNVKLHDNLRVRFIDINGQNQACKLIIVAIMKPSNVFMSAPIFLEVQDLKKIGGYGPNDMGQMYIRIADPKKFAKKYADSLYKALIPQLAVVEGKLDIKGNSSDVKVIGFRSDSVGLAVMKAEMEIFKGKDTAIGKSSVCMGARLAKKLSVAPGDTCRVTYKGKYDSISTVWPMIISSIIDGSGKASDFIYVNDRDFFKQYYSHWPPRPSDTLGLPSHKDTFYPALAGEWFLMERSKTTQDAANRYSELARKRIKGTSVNVQSMYESASTVLNLEYALNMITFVAVMLLFFIILIGVVNTLRMTIRERTREIGTVRAIGMQRKDVRNTFLIESGFLAFFSALAGTALAFTAMWGFTQITFNNMQDNPMGMLLDSGHLHFAPTAGATIFFILFIIALSVVTAWFPARKAAKLSAAEALRHFE